MPAIIHQNQIIGQATNAEALVKDTVGWTGKNLLKNTATTQTINGVTFTVNADKSITVNGTSSGSCQFFISIGVNLDTDKRYILSGCPINDIGAHLQHSSWVSGGEYVIDNGNGVEYNGYDAQQYPNNRVFIFIPNGKTANNLVFRPMIRKADITDPTYEPYHESVEEEIEQIYADNGVLGAKNLLPNDRVVSKTVNGVTFTANKDGSITANGTATGRINYELLSDKECLNKFGRQKYKSSGCPSGGSSSTYFIYIHPGRHNNTWDTAIFDYGNGMEFEYDGLTQIFYSVTIIAGTTVNNLTFKPMLRLASDPDDTYQPYAMTNRELTEKVFEKRVLTSADDLNDITETGIYKIRTAPVNSPESVAYATLIVCKYDANDINQMIYRGGSSSGNIYVRSKGGSPSAWTSWYKFTGTVVS